MDGRQFDLSLVYLVFNKPFFSVDCKISSFLVVPKLEGNAAGCASATEEEKQEVPACPAATEEIRLDAAAVAALSAPDDFCALEGVQKAAPAAFLVD